MIKISNHMYNLGKRIIIVISALIIFYLTILAGFSTTFIAANEMAYLVKDSFLLNILFLIVFLIVLLKIVYPCEFVRRIIYKVNNDVVFYHKCRKIVLISYSVVLVCIILVLQKNARGDQLDIFNVASEWLEEDYSSLEQGGYLDFYPNQIGIVLILYFCSHLFGVYNYTLFHAVNMIALLLIIKAFCDFSDLLGNNRSTSLAIMLFSTLFFPPALYVTFAYGTIIGLCFSIYATKSIVIINKTNNWLMIIPAVFCSFMAVVIKSNYLIFLIGNIVLVMMLILKKYNAKLMILLPVLVIVLLFNSKVIRGIASVSTGMEIGTGMSSYSWIAMGLMENDHGYNGWWNNYNGESYVNNSFNRELQADECKVYIRDRLRYFWSNKGEALKYFAGKNASQWNIPDFQGSWINRVMPSDLQYPEWIIFLETERGACWINRILNYWHFIILCGVVLYLILGEKDDVALVFFTVFIGGFIFHSFWEAKGQYTLPYFMLLLPMSAQGLIEFLKVLRQKKFRKLAILVVLAIAILIGRLGQIKTFHDVFVRVEDTDKYYEILQEQQ